MATNDFSFVEAYRVLAPMAEREIIDAREKAHGKLYATFVKSWDNVLQVCRLAFQLAQDTAELVEWFQKGTREFDPHFTIDIDKAETARVASLLLRDFISRGSAATAFIVLAASYCGRREPLDPNLVPAARNATTRLAQERRIVLAEKKIVAPSAKDLKPELDAILANWNQTTVIAAITAAATDYRSSISKIAVSVNEVHQSLRSDVARLSEEVDMLWWHIGDWAETLSLPRSDFHAEAVGVVSGIELGLLVKELPGPYGAYGILRRTLGKTADTKTKLQDVIGRLGGSAERLAVPMEPSMMSLFPIHAAMRLVADRGEDRWLEAFPAAAGDLSSKEVSNFDLAIQAFRERALINLGVGP